MGKQVSAVAAWYGSGRMIGPAVGRALGKRAWIGVPFCGGMAEIAHMDARTILANDLHRHVINLGIMIRDAGEELVKLLDGCLVHPNELKEAQTRCLQREAHVPAWPLGDILWARDYFLCSWMARNGKAGTLGEFQTGLSYRYEAGGGDSAVRCHSAKEAILEWQKVFTLAGKTRVTFTCEDAFTLIDKFHDKAEHALYIDAPWLQAGDCYKHPFTPQHHFWLRDAMESFKETKVVIRYGDCDFVRGLYLEPAWEFQTIEGRTAANKIKGEVLITRRK